MTNSDHPDNEIDEPASADVLAREVLHLLPEYLRKYAIEILYDLEREDDDFRYEFGLYDEEVHPEDRTEPVLKAAGLLERVLGHGPDNRPRLDELERAAREAREKLAKVPHHSGPVPPALGDAKQILDAALDESEGRGGGEKEPVHRRRVSNLVAQLKDEILIGGGFTVTAAKVYDEINRELGTLADTPDPSEGEVGCDHENTVLDDNVEWCPDCRRVMPEHAEDDGRGEGWSERARNLLGTLLEDIQGGRTDSVVDCPCSRVAGRTDEIADLLSQAPTHSDADPELGHDVEDVREQSDEELVDALESLARNFCLEAGFGYAPVNLAGLEIKRRLQNRSDADPEIEFRATECNDDPITAPLSEVQEHRSWPVCPACNSFTCREPIGEVPGLTGSDADPIGEDLREDAAETIDWLLDLLEMYDEKLIELGEPEEKVRSDVHLQGKAKARDILRRLRRTEDAGEESSDA